MKKHYTDLELNRIAELQTILKKGDRVSCKKCSGFRTFTFDHFEGYWMVSKSGINDYHPCSVRKINGKLI